MSDELVKTDNPDFKKDMNTGALVSTDVAAFNKYKLQQQQAEEVKSQKNDLNNIKSEVSDLRNELGEIKDILKQLLNK
tara:strand:- start:343 stop:576 length:234 start_codon:yes stop_codon:yes gene_type:complete